MTVTLEDADLVDKLVSLEGAAWLNDQRRRPAAPHSLFAIQAAWRCKQASDFKDCSDTPLSEFEPLSGSDTHVLYGSGGWNRYLVTATGEVVLLRSSCRDATAVHAGLLGFSLG